MGVRKFVGVVRKGRDNVGVMKVVGVAKRGVRKLVGVVIGAW